MAARYRVVETRHDPGAIVHVVEDARGRALYVNGKPDSHTADDRVARTLTALTPLSIAPKTERVFIIGLGAGLSTSVAAQFDEVERVEVAEISQGVIDVLPQFAAANVGLEANRDKVEIVRGDARQVLLRSPDRYDLILCEPSSTWVTGVEKLFTLDFYQQAIDKLEPGGLYAQWLTVGNMDDETFVSILATFARVFPWSTAWSAGGGTLTLLGGRAAPVVDFERVVARYERHRAVYERVEIGHPLAILANQLLPPATIDQLAAGVDRYQTLEQPLLAYRSGRAFFASRYVDLDRLIAQELPKALDPGDPDAHFVLDAYPEPLPAELFAAKRAFDQSAQLNWNFTRSHTRWLQALAGVPDPERPFDAELVRAGEYMLAGATGIPPASLPRMIEAYWSLKFAQLPVRTEAIVGMIDAVCPHADCTPFQLRLLQAHLSTEALAENGIAVPFAPGTDPAAVAARIRALYDATFHSQSG